MFNWRRRVWGFPVPRLDDGVLAENYTLDLARLHRQRQAIESAEASVVLGELVGVKQHVAILAGRETMNRFIVSRHGASTYFLSAIHHKCWCVRR